MTDSAKEVGSKGDRMRRRVGARGALVALGAGVIVALLTLEIAAQAYLFYLQRTEWAMIRSHPQHFFEKAGSESLGYRMRAGWDEQNAGRWLRVNEHGIRDRFDDVPEDAWAVAILGDSVVFGNNLTQERTLSELLQRRLDPTRLNTVVLNFGMSGYNLDQVMEFLRQKDAVYGVDHIVFVLNSNDFCRTGTLTEGASGGLYRMYNAPLLKSPWMVRKAIYRWIRGPKSSPKLEWYRWVFRRNGGRWRVGIRELAGYAHGRGAGLTVVLLPAASAYDGGAYGLQAEHDEVLSFLRAEGIDSVTLVESLAAGKESLFDRTDHCTEAGNEALADVLNEHLAGFRRRAIEERLGGS